jgi:Outer membrane protein beta-barrel domain
VGRVVWLLVATTVGTVALPRGAAAQESFVNFLVGNTTTSSDGGGGGPRAVYGIAFGSLVPMAGAEIEFVYLPQLFDTQVVSTSRAFSVMGDVFVGPTIGRARIYGAIGVGDLYVNLSSAAADFSSHYLTVNGGAGVAVFFGSHLGVRGDLRYYHPTGLVASDLEPVNVDPEQLKFWRPTVGLTLKF